MFETTAMLFLCAETPLHAGSGRGLGAIDLPIQRERITDYPMIQASGIKGRLRAEAELAVKRTADQDERERKRAELIAIFGPETGNASDHAGALAVGDARLLLFPVRSLAGVFAWTTSLDALARFRREATLANLPVPALDLTAPSEEAALVTNAADVVAGESVVLEEYSFTPERGQAEALDRLAGWLAANALPQGGEYEYWRAALTRKLVVLPETVFRDFARYGTEVQTHVKLGTETKTVERGMLWTVESLPVDTLLYAPLLATPSRVRNGTGPSLTGAAVLARVQGLGLTRLQLGGDETTGQGIVATRVVTGAAGGENGGRA